MKHQKLHKLVSGLLSVIMLLCMLPVQAMAVENENFFYFAAWTETKLVAAPEKITYDEGQSIKQALSASNHIFKGIDADWIEEIDGVTGNYTRSDENGGFGMDRAASEIKYFCFAESDGFMTVSRQKLIKTMADYLDEDSDVQKAAKSEYDAAREGFVTADEDTAELLSSSIINAVETYKTAQGGTTYTVTFLDNGNGCTQTAYPGIEITAENEYGKTYRDDDGDGCLSLVAGDYTFSAVQDYNSVEGKMTVSENAEVSFELPSGDWMLAGAEISTGSGDNFDAQKLEVTYENHVLSAAVADTYSGGIFLYAQYNDEIFSEPPSLYACYTRTNGDVINPETDSTASKRTWNSKASAVTKLLSKGTDRVTMAYLISTTDENGYTCSQTYTVNLDRGPTLSQIRLSDQKGTDQSATESFSPGKYEYTYRVLTTVKSVTVKPTPLFADYSVTVNGAELTDGEAVVPVSGNTDIIVNVTSGQYSETYTLHIVPAAGSNITFNTTGPDVKVDVINANGEKMFSVVERQANGYYAYRYTLVPGETYTYIATKDEYYHAKKSFTMEESAGSIVTVDVPTEDWINDLTFGDSSALSSIYVMDSTFETAVHSYTVYVNDSSNAVFARAGSDISGLSFTAEYSMVSDIQSKNGVSTSLAMRTGGVKRLTDICMSNAVGNTVSIRASKTENGVTYYQDYQVAIERRLSLGSLNVQYNDSSLLLEPAYSDDVTEYSVTVPMGAGEIDIKASLRSSIPVPFGETEHGYEVKVNGEKTENGSATVSLTGTEEKETAVITVVSSKNEGASTDITLTVNKVPPVSTTVTISPESALLVLKDTGSGNRIWPEDDGTWELSKGFSYSYTLTAKGYVGDTGTISIAENEDGDTVIELSDGRKLTALSDDSGSMYISFGLELAQALENTTIDHTIESEWADFRGTSYIYDAASGGLIAGGANYTHNGVTSAKTPVSSDDSTLYWATKLGEGYSSSAVGCPIIVDDDLITYSENKIYRVDSISGEVLATGTMYGGSSFAINPPTYYDGMIFVALSSGRVQAFDAKTLTSLWLYTDETGGQPNCPLTVYNGYLYTGFWVGEETDASFVCLSVTDEDPSSTTESKIPSWTTTSKGGFYWAGAYVCDDFLMVGTDDGISGYTTDGKVNVGSKLLLLDPATGKILDTRDNLYGDIRSNVSYDGATDAYYFTSKGGYFYRAKVGQVDGSWKITQLDELKLENYSSLESNPAMSTCTPVIYNGRAYIGISGIGQFTSYSGHNLTVIDLAGWKIAYKIRTQGYPQTSGLLTTAYEDTGYVYVYFFDNFTPGKLRVIRDRPGQTEAEYVTQESYSDKGTTTVYDTPYVLFTPSGDQAQYAICSPLVDSYGTIYFKNDSAYLMALGNSVESIQITKAPDKTEYTDGETFDATGMEVTLTYSNGMTRDVTKYVTWSEDPLTTGDDTVTITFPYVMYHNSDNADGTSETGILTQTPYTTLDITVSGGSAYILGDANGDGKVDSNDSVAVLREFAAPGSVTGFNNDAADINGDGKADSNDAVAILKSFAGN